MLKNRSLPLFDDILMKIEKTKDLQNISKASNTNNQKTKKNAWSFKMIYRKMIEKCK